MVSDIVNFDNRPRADHAKLVHRSDLSCRLTDFRNEFQFANRRKMLVAREHICLKSVRNYRELVLHRIDLTLDQSSVILCH